MTDVARQDPGVALGRVLRVGQDADVHVLDARVDVGVVDDLPRQEDAPVRELLARLVRVLDRAVDAVAEAELAGEGQGELARPGEYPSVFRRSTIRLS
jgi:hypothetical protein